MAWFSGPGGDSHRRRSSSSSYYRRRPRDGFVQRIIYQIKRIFRDFYGYARQHPVKVFMMIIMPLITGGALTKILRQLGVRLPAGFGAGMSSFGGKGMFDGFSDRKSGFGDLGGGGAMQNVMKVAQMFI